MGVLPNTKIKAEEDHEVIDEHRRKRKRDLDPPRPATNRLITQPAGLKTRHDGDPDLDFQLHAAATVDARPCGWPLSTAACTRVETASGSSAAAPVVPHSHASAANAMNTYHHPRAHPNNTSRLPSHLLSESLPSNITNHSRIQTPSSATDSWCNSAQHATSQSSAFSSQILHRWEVLPCSSHSSPYQPQQYQATGYQYDGQVPSTQLTPTQPVSTSGKNSNSALGNWSSLFLEQGENDKHLNRGFASSYAVDTTLARHPADHSFRDDHANLTQASGGQAGSYLIYREALGPSSYAEHSSGCGQTLCSTAPEYSAFPQASQYHSAQQELHFGQLYPNAGVEVLPQQQHNTEQYQLKQDTADFYQSVHSLSDQAKGNQSEQSPYPDIPAPMGGGETYPSHIGSIIGQISAHESDAASCSLNYKNPAAIKKTSTTPPASYNGSQPAASSGVLTDATNVSTYQHGPDSAQNLKLENAVCDEGDPGYGVICVSTDTEDDEVVNVHPHDVPFNGRRQQARQRGAYDAEQRKQTAETRKKRACLRCRKQKTRCLQNDEDPEGPCHTCLKFSKTSKKTLHLLDCFRGKLTDATLFRRGGLQLTRRWSGIEMKDIAERPCRNDVRTIVIALDICDTAMTVEAVGFSPKAGDVTARYWTTQDANGREVRKEKDLAAYCLADIHKTANYWGKYIIRNAIPCFEKYYKSPKRLHGHLPEHPIVRRTYDAAVQHYASFENNPDSPERKLLGNIFVLWFAMKHTTGMSYICGEETLGMEPVRDDESYPLFGKVSLPRLIVAQFDSINYTKVLSLYSKRVLKQLDQMLGSRFPGSWWTLYLSMFILLREASWISTDRYRHARSNCGNKIRYSIPGFVEELHESCNNLINHWHYYSSYPWPDPEKVQSQQDSFFAELTAKQYQLVVDTMTDPDVRQHISHWNHYTENNGKVNKPEIRQARDCESEYIGSQQQFDWDHPLYWVSQLYEHHTKWSAHPTYRRE